MVFCVVKDFQGNELGYFLLKKEAMHTMVSILQEFFTGQQPADNNKLNIELDLFEQHVSFWLHSKVSGFRNKSIESLSIRLNQFNNFLKTARLRKIKSITYRNLSRFDTFLFSIEKWHVNRLASDLKLCLHEHEDFMRLDDRSSRRYMKMDRLFESETTVVRIQDEKPSEKT